MSPIHAPSQPFIQHLSQHDSGLPPPSLSLRTPPRAECPPTPATRPDIHQSPSVGRAGHELRPLHAPSALSCVLPHRPSHSALRGTAHPGLSFPAAALTFSAEDSVSIFMVLQNSTFHYQSNTFSL